MITIKEARTVAEKHLSEIQLAAGNPLQLINVREVPYGWVFFYQSKDYMKTKNLSSMLAGNAPFIVDRETGALQALGTAYPVETYLKEYALLHA